MDANADLSAASEARVPHELVALATKIPLFLALLGQAGPPKSWDLEAVPANWRGLPGLATPLSLLLNRAVAQNLYRLGNAARLQKQPLTLCADRVPSVALLDGLLAVAGQRPAETPELAVDAARVLVDRVVALLGDVAFWKMRGRATPLETVVQASPLCTTANHQLDLRFYEDIKPRWKRLLTEVGRVGFAGMGAGWGLAFAHALLERILVAQALTALQRAGETPAFHLSAGDMLDVLALLAGLPSVVGRPQVVEAVHLALAMEPDDPVRRGHLVERLLGQWREPVLVQFTDARGALVRGQVAVLAKAVAPGAPYLAALLLWQADQEKDLPVVVPYLCQEKVLLLGLPDKVITDLIRLCICEKREIAYWAVKQIIYLPLEHRTALVRAALGHKDDWVRWVAVRQVKHLPEGERWAVVRRAQDDVELMVREEADRQLRWLHEREQVEALRCLLANKNPWIRQKAVRWLEAGQLTHLPEAEQLAVVREMLASVHTSVRQAAVEQIACLPEIERTAALRRVLVDGDTRIREVAAKQMALLSEAQRAAVVREMLASAHSTVQQAAVGLVAHLPEGERANALRQALVNGNTGVRKAAVEQLEYLPEAERAAVVRRELADSDSLVKGAAVHQVAHLPEAERAMVVREMLASAHLAVQSAAARQVAHLPEAERAAVVREMLASVDFRVRFMADKQVAHLAVVERAAVIREMLASTYTQVQSAAVRLIAYLPEAERAAVLCRALEDIDAGVRQTAVREVLSGCGHLSESAHAALIWRDPPIWAMMDQSHMRGLQMDVKDVIRLFWILLSPPDNQDPDPAVEQARWPLLHRLLHTIPLFAEHLIAQLPPAEHSRRVECLRAVVWDVDTPADIAQPLKDILASLETRRTPGAPS